MTLFSNWRSAQPFLLTGLAVFLIGMGITELAFYQDGLRRAEVRRQQVTSAAGEVRAILESELNASLHLTSGLVAYIQSRAGVLKGAEIDPWLRGLMEQGRHIRNLGIAPGNRITYIYPLKGNEAALGLYYPNNPQQWPAVERAIRERRPLLAGPVVLQQGGRGLVYRVPVFLHDGRYWGVLSTVVNADELATMIGRLAQENGLAIALSNGQDNSTPGNFLLGGTADVPQALVTLPVTVPGGAWELAARPLAGAGTTFVQAGLRLGGWMLSLFTATLVTLLLRANARGSLMQQNLSESQRRFSRIFETAPQGMALLDIQGRWLDANDVLCSLIGYTREELQAHHLADVTVPEDIAQCEAALGRVLTSPAHKDQWEMGFAAKTGEVVPVLCSVGYVEAKTPYLVAQIQDMREYKRLERMKSEFVSTVSHELRTPLTSISGSLGLMASGTLGALAPPQQALVDIAHRNSLRLGHLINDLLDMEKLAAGKMVFNLRVQRLQPLLEEALASNRAYAERFNVELVLEGTATQWVKVDGLRLQQVLSNLLSNAAKFSPAGSTVRIVVSEANGSVRVAVHDRGPGIPESFRARIFQKFSQSDSSDKREKGGTGLGLAITKQLLEYMDGRIDFLSEPGRGATFWFELACAPPESD